MKLIATFGWSLSQPNLPWRGCHLERLQVEIPKGFHCPFSASDIVALRSPMHLEVAAPVAVFHHPSAPPFYMLIGGGEFLFSLPFPQSPEQ